MSSDPLSSVEEKKRRTCFVGNIPYDLSEEQIVDILRSAGQVVSFRLVHDADTGKPRGYGFCEYTDVDAAATAVRNLHGHEIMGRPIRVDFSKNHAKDHADDLASFSNPQTSLSQTQPMSNGYAPPQHQHQQQQPSSTGLPPLPVGVDLQPGLTCPDAISKTLSTLPPPQLLDILSQMKGLVMADPAKATELLKQAPQLSYAIFQALLLMGLVDTSVLSQVVEQASQPNPHHQQQQPPPPPPQLPPQPQPLPMQQHIQQQPPQPHQRPPPIPQPYQPTPPQPAYGAYPQIPQMQAQHHVPTPPVHQPLAYQPPPTAPPPVQAPMGQEELLKQVMQMSQQQIDMLPPAERSQIIMLRQQLMASGVRF
ncbi:hypothetical protein MMC20_000888 [Loxospora ochrophaea]|nr:hypothetical protein [Loxospora ochrophaea]